jgi:hypothetical protein
MSPSQVDDVDRPVHPCARRLKTDCTTSDCPGTHSVTSGSAGRGRQALMSLGHDPDGIGTGGRDVERTTIQ